MTERHDFTRRELLACVGAAAGTALLPAPLRAADALLTPTPRQTAGPFYPVELPLDSDNDLVRIEGRDGTARGVLTNVYGRVLDPNGSPLRDLRVEIWQCDAGGRYHHPRDRAEGTRDDNFQGFGATSTDGEGRYRFRTIRPVPYPGRTPHIHFRILGRDLEPLTTQMYIRGEPRNDTDGVLRGIGDPAARERLMVAFVPESDASAELRAEFDIVLAARAMFERG